MLVLFIILLLHVMMAIGVPIVSLARAQTDNVPMDWMVLDYAISVNLDILVLTVTTRVLVLKTDIVPQEFREQVCALVVNLNFMA